ncbi:MAG: aldehyde dehydrogenase family protein, partial [Myxococcota bacterium]
MVRPGSIHPASGAPLPDFAWSSPSAVAEIVARARAASVGWAATPAATREAAALALGRRILERREEALAVLQLETGRDPAESLLGEVAFALAYARGAVEVSRQALAPERVKLSPIDFPGKRAVIEAVPRGVIAIVEPWNYPLLQFYKPLFPALLAGNAVVLKPSEHTPRTAAWLVEQARACFPPELVQVVYGDGAVGAALIDDDVDGVVFCGSVNTGRRVAARCGERLIPCSVELGGKDAAIVLADCDLPRTAAGILQWSLHNAGQDCSSIERVYVEEPVADALVRHLALAVGKLKVAGREGVRGDLGPLQNAAQLALVERQVAEAVAAGAELVCGGKRTGVGFGYLPTVLDRCTPAMDVMRDETFGPVIAICRVADAEDAVRRANATRYGLSGSVWTRDLARGEALARRLQVGIALVNNHSFPGSLPQIPWTGTRDTGSGVAASRHAYPVFVRRRTVVVDRSRDPP